jgi:hypothetical protein
MLHEQGDLTEFPCALCPARLFPEPNDLDELVHRVCQLIADHPFPDHPPDMSFIFQLLGIPVGSAKSREVYRRVLRVVELTREHQRRMKGENGQPSGGGPPELAGAS